MSNTGKDVASEVQAAIVRFAVKIIEEPLTYFSEADCQQLLVEELRNVRGFAKRPETQVHCGQDSKRRYRVPLIHREYGGGKKTRIDVVVFDPGDVHRIDSAKIKIGKDYLVPEYAFELGTEKTADAAKHVKKDMKKVGNAAHGGYILHLYRDGTVAQTGTKARTRTEQKISRIFKKPLEAAYAARGNVHVLGVLIRVGRKQPRMLNKCEIIREGGWQAVNVGDRGKILAAITEALAGNAPTSTRVC